MNQVGDYPPYPVRSVRAQAKPCTELPVVLGLCLGPLGLAHHRLAHTTRRPPTRRRPRVRAEARGALVTLRPAEFEHRGWGSLVTLFAVAGLGSRSRARAGGFRKTAKNIERSQRSIYICLVGFWLPTIIPGTIG